MESIIKVDLNDNNIGEIEKLKAHKTPVLHRAFSVFLVCDNKILIQKRAKQKYHSGGLWANSCCSHPRPNMSFLDSVKQRVYFELGIDADLQYKEIFSFTYYSKYAEDLYEYEFDHVLIAQCTTDININYNKDEIEELKWIDINFLEKDMVNNPTKYATWFLICAPKVFEYIKNNIITE